MIGEHFCRLGITFLIATAPIAVLCAVTARAADTQLAVGGVPVDDVLGRLGAKMEAGVTAEQLEGYAGHFDRVDLDRGGSHSAEEFIVRGTYMSERARRGIFAAADCDGDGEVSKAEYLLNRIITDEGKAIMQAMDDDRDGAIQAGEFGEHALEGLGGKELCDHVFGAFDTDEDGEVRVPEYLRVWGRWARSGKPAAARRIEACQERLSKEAEAGASPGGGSRPAGGRPGSGPPSVDQLFERFDKDGDGKLSKGEMPQGAIKFLQPADSDRDGFVSKEELLEHRKKPQR